jgi:hypothetical protein
MHWSQNIAKILNVEKWGGQISFDSKRDVVFITNVCLLPEEFFSYLKKQNVKIHVTSSQQSLSGFEVKLRGYPNYRLKFMILIVLFLGLGAFIFPYFTNYI